MIKIGPYNIQNNLFLAPLAGISDAPFREICSELGAGIAIGEMLTCNADLWTNKKNRFKQIKPCIRGHQIVQIVGSDPEMMAIAAHLNVAAGATVIDINMGCPAKKVLKKAAGSALLRNTDLVAKILRAVVLQVDVPVTLKIRTGWNTDNRNGVEIARIAEQNGIQSLAVHGRTRACMYKGEAEFDTIRRIKEAISIPVIANGDITSPEKAQQVLNCTGADGVMIGRGAQGNPWIFKEILHYLETGENLKPPPLSEQYEILHEHVANVQSFYGEVAGVRIARKHVGWYLSEHDTDRQFRKSFNAIEDASAQLEALNAYFEALQNRETRQISPAA